MNIFVGKDGMFSFEHVLIFIVISCFPLYFLVSGSLQVAHYFIILFAALIFSKPEFLITNKVYMILLLGLLTYMILRQVIFFIEYNRLVYMPIAFLIFNIALFFSLGSYIHKHHEHFISHLKYPLFLSIIIVFIGFYFTGISLTNNATSFEGISHISTEGVRYRSIGTFNNPNQLGFFGVCVGGMITYLFALQRINIIEFSLSAGMIIVMVAASLSKAAMISVIFYGLVLCTKRTYKYLLAIIFLFFIGLIILAQFIELNDLKILNRLLSIGNASDDSLAGRGYGPLLDPDIRLLFGWGEGYSEMSINHEVHSTLGNLLISYGLIGFLLFGFLVLFIFLRVKNMFNVILALALFMPPMLYGLTHNGIRFSIFWVFLAVLAFMPINISKKHMMYYNSSITDP
tara:strand:- start:110 stop:1312 length:1203 start_codon:yes stop_codon:yes gene_type:complete